MILIPVFITLAISLVIAGKPSPHTTNKPSIFSGIRVPTRGTRRVAQTPSGIFDQQTAVAHLNLTINKYRRGLVNLLNNKGPGALDEGVTIGEIREVNFPQAITKRQSEALTDENDTWDGIISIGTPSQTVLAEIDNAIGDSFVPVSGCETCQGKTLFDLANSSSSTLLRQGVLEIDFAEGSGALGIPFQDTASITVQNQTIAGINATTGDVFQFFKDGVMGLGFPSIAGLGANNPIFNAFAQGQIPSPQFSVKLSENDSSLFIGGQDPLLFNGSTEFTPLATNMGFWEVSDASIKANGASTVFGFNALIDTSTAFLIGPTKGVKKFYSQVPNAKVFDKTNGLFSVPCSNIPQVALNFGGEDWVVNANDLNLGPTAQGSNDCVLSVVGQDFGFGHTWIFGAPLMKVTYTTFDFGELTIGFSRLSENSVPPAPAPVPAPAPAPAPCPCNCTTGANKYEV
ncbi:hypothetical protein Clacol_008269 [Clathrus columnatus]|uniref:Peptidase A1 domain-containing protein n=1 Tax=Clathrus columnatus TaxID=1419009 RepID=A0AAV5AH90_9AGAM|nr:hypothetical protein Clacol_008269 [Clathrus columnatus]